jgi:hypothetical protein
MFKSLFLGQIQSFVIDFLSGLAVLGIFYAVMRWLGLISKSSHPTAVNRTHVSPVNRENDV